MNPQRTLIFRFRHVSQVVNCITFIAAISSFLSRLFIQDESDILQDKYL